MKAVAYMARTRRYYRALGYPQDYVWAQHDDVPFAPLTRPLASSTVALIGTATPTDDSGGPRLPKAVYSFPSDGPAPRLYTEDLAWDRVTHTEDPESFLPLERLREAASSGRIGRVARRVHSVPTEYSQRRTNEHDAPEVLRRCREDGVDVALLVPL